MINFVIPALLKKLPWGKIIIGLLIGGALLAIGLYIRNAEKNRAEVQRLEAAQEQILKANEENIRFFEKNIIVLQEQYNEALEREKSFEDNIAALRGAADSGCARSSSPIVNSIRLRHERRASGSN